MKCVKSVIGEFSSGVSIYRNKGTQSDLSGGPLFARAPRRGIRRILPPALVLRVSLPFGYAQPVVVFSHDLDNLLLILIWPLVW